MSLDAAYYMSVATYTRGRQIRQWLIAIGLAILFPVGCFALFWGPRFIALRTAPSGFAIDVEDLALKISLSEPTAVLPGEATAIRYRNANFHGGLVEVQFHVPDAAFERWSSERGYNIVPWQHVRDFDVGEGREYVDCLDCRSISIPETSLEPVKVGQTNVLQADLAYSSPSETGYLRLTTAAGW